MLPPKRIAPDKSSTLGKLWNWGKVKPFNGPSFTQKLGKFQPFVVGFQEAQKIQLEKRLIKRWAKAQGTILASFGNPKRFPTGLGPWRKFGCGVTQGTTKSGIWEIGLKVVKERGAKWVNVARELTGFFPFS